MADALDLGYAICQVTVRREVHSSSFNVSFSSPARGLDTLNDRSRRSVPEQIAHRGDNLTVNRKAPSHRRANQIRSTAQNVAPVTTARLN
jgi:hypothetical protein